LNQGSKLVEGALWRRNRPGTPHLGTNRADQRGVSGPTSAAGELSVTIRVIYLDGTAMVWAAGSLDGTMAPDLYTIVDGLVARSPATVLLDLVAVSYVDDVAVAVLAAAATRLAYQGAELELRLPAGSAMTIADSRALRQALARAYPVGGQSEPG
jgi:anti-anti-sigma regulatory factor